MKGRAVSGEQVKMREGLPSHYYLKVELDEEPHMLPGAILGCEVEVLFRKPSTRDYDKEIDEIERLGRIANEARNKLEVAERSVAEKTNLVNIRTRERDSHATEVSRLRRKLETSDREVAELRQQLGRTVRELDQARGAAPEFPRSGDIMRFNQPPLGVQHALIIDPESRMKAIQAIIKERSRQDDMWGDEHDDHLGWSEWRGLIDRYMERAQHADSWHAKRGLVVKAAALGLAAIESYDREEAGRDG
jgi:hypothetical protein